MNKPIIAVTPRYDSEGKTCWQRENYLSCLGAAGAIPVILSCCDGTYGSQPDFEAIVNRFDGFLFSGGADIHPGLYGEELLDCCGEIDPERDSFELPLMREALRQNKPVLGICRGQQLLNIALGGSLHQDFPSQLSPGVKLNHSQEEPYAAHVHQVNVIKGTPLHKLVQLDQLSVNSMHHQAVKKLADGLHSMAVADDGIIEAVYHTEKRFVVGVQWHPEYLGMHTPESEKIFVAFVDACSK